MMCRRITAIEEVSCAARTLAEACAIRIGAVATLREIYRRTAEEALPAEIAALLESLGAEPLGVDPATH